MPHVPPPPYYGASFAAGMLLRAVNEPLAIGARPATVALGGLVLAYIGGTLLAGTWWPLATFPIALVAVQNLVIGSEERYLSERFGPTYLSYQSRVRRWL